MQWRVTREGYQSCLENHPYPETPALLAKQILCDFLSLNKSKPFTCEAFICFLNSPSPLFYS